MTDLTTIALPAGTHTIRRARRDDLPALVSLLADDPLGTGRETPADLSPYERAFAAIDADPAQLLVVAVDEAGERSATLQLTFIPGLSRAGTTRAQIEGVRVHRDHRGTGLGSALIAWALAESARRGCTVVQLTSDKQRPEAHRFYTNLGFVPSHEGFKLSRPS